MSSARGIGPSHTARGRGPNQTLYSRVDRTERAEHWRRHTQRRQIFSSGGPIMRRTRRSSLRNIRHGDNVRFTRWSWTKCSHFITLSSLENSRPQGSRRLLSRASVAIHTSKRTGRKVALLTSTRCAGLIVGLLSVLLVKISLSLFQFLFWVGGRSSTSNK